MVGVGEEHVPQPGLARAHLQLLHDRRLVVEIARVAQLLLVDRLGWVHVLVHERHETLLEFGTARARLELHRSSSVATVA